AALAYRAREKLRQAYLQAHLVASPHPECEPHRSRLGAHVRGGLSRRDQAATKRHVDRCPSCQALVAELTDVNRMLVRSLLPLFLVGGSQVTALATAGAAAGGVTAGTAGKDAAAGAPPGSASGGKGPWRRVRDLAPSAGSAGVAAALVAGLTAASLTVSRGDGPNDVAADAAGLGSSGFYGGSGFDGGGDGSFGPDPTDTEPPGGDALTLDPFDSPTGPDPDAPSSGGFDGRSPSRFDARPPFDDGPPLGGPTSPPPGPPPGPSPTAPRASPPPAATPPPPTRPTPPPPAGPAPTPPPPPPLVAPPLAFAGAPVWAPSGVGRGELTVRIGEANAQVASAAVEPTATTAAASATAGDRQLQIQLTSEAEAAEDGLDPRCTVVASGGGRTVECVIQPPPPGGSTEVRLALNTGAPDQSATVTLHRASVVEDSAVVPLDRYEEGLGLVASAWAPFGLEGHELPIGRLTIGAEHLGTRPFPGVSLEVTLAGDAGFVPAVPGDSLLPDGCSAPNWPPPGGSGEVPLPSAPSRSPALVGGLPITAVCDLGALVPGDAPALRDLVALVRPWYRDGDGVDEEPLATVTLKLRDPAVNPNAPPEIHEIATATVDLDLPEG
ncbi:MAG: zf-HC2 domain-containing protein, partial [Acidimicrobiales bacterium]